MPRPKVNFLGNTSDEQTFDDRIAEYLKLHLTKKVSVAASTGGVVSSGGGSIGPPGPAGASVINATKLTVADTPYPVPFDTTAINAYRVDASGGAVTLQLPPAVGSGAILLFTKIDQSVNKVTIQAQIGEQIGDANGFDVGQYRSSVEIYDADGGQWDVRMYTAMA